MSRFTSTIVIRYWYQYWTSTLHFTDTNADAITSATTTLAQTAIDYIIIIVIISVSRFEKAY